MHWRTLAGAAVVLRLAGLAFGYGTTISIGVSYCPATYPSSSTSSSTTSSASTMPSVAPGEPVVLAFAANGTSQYLRTDATFTDDSSQAAYFAVSPSGQLMGGNGYVSTSGEVAFQPFTISPDTPGMKRASLIFTQFLIDVRNTLEWLNSVFVGGKAIFCVSGSTVIVVFNGVAPFGCVVIELGAIPIADVNPPFGTSTTGMPQSTSGNMPSMSTGMSTGRSSTPNLINTASTTPSVPHSSSPGSGPSTPPASSSAMAQSTPNSIPSSSSGSASPSASGSAYPAPTTTGTPNCYDRSPYDGTVNDNNLILCDTNLPGYNLETVAATDIAACIDACSSYVPSSQGPCVAVVFDILASANPCHLKYAIDTVNRGADAFSQAAIVVNEPYAPNIIFADPGSAPTSASTAEPSSTTVGPPPPASTMATTSPNAVITATTSPASPPASPTTGNGIPAGPSSARPTPQSSSNAIPQSSQPVVSLQIAGTSSRASPSANPVSSSPNAASSSQQQASGMTTSRNPASSSPVINPASSSPVSSPPPSTPTSMLVNPVSTSGLASSGPAATSQATPGSTTPLVSTISPVSSRTTTGLASTAAASYCSATPTTTNLCSTYNHQALNVNSDGYCYEVECATALQGTVLTGNSTIETSLKNCIGECTNYNVVLPYGCVGVSYLGTSAGPGVNCLLMSSITGTMASANINSGRLLYAGYPSINDPIYALSSSTTSPAAAASTITTPVVSASSVMTSPTTSTSYVPTVCPAAPTDATTICPGGSASCYQYSYLGNTDNYEIECSSLFTGSSSQPLLTFDLNDCINQCQYANVLRTNGCLGVSFVVNTIGQGTTNNCYPYSSITCATRGNSTYHSARLLYAGYPRITDYTDPAFVCGGSAASSSAAVASSSPTVSSAAAITTTARPTTVAQAAASTSASSAYDPSQATSSNFPNAFPQDPVCNNNLRSTYFGGQLQVSGLQGRIYDIECASDYTNSGNNPYGATTQPTYDSCANQCDIAAGSSTVCAAFSWTASSGLCTLFGRVSNGIQLTTNMTQTNGVHSGRLLLTGSSVQTLQLYLAQPTPFPVGPISSGSTTARDYPGGTNTYFDGWSDTNHATLLDLSVVLPGFTWQIFDQTTRTLWVTANFWFTNTNLQVTSSTQNTWSTLSRNSDTAPLSFPANNLPAYTLAPFWSYGHIIGAGQQGIYYQIDLISTGRYYISIEWFFSHYGQDNNVFHAITTYNTGRPGIWNTWFFSAGASSGANTDQGTRQTVGGQGNPNTQGQYFTYCAGVANCVTPGAKITMDTTQSNVAAVMNYTAALFNPATYPVGTWSYSTRPSTSG